MLFCMLLSLSKIVWSVTPLFDSYHLYKLLYLESANSFTMRSRQTPLCKKTFYQPSQSEMARTRQLLVDFTPNCSTNVRLRPFKIDHL